MLPSMSELLAKVPPENSKSLLLPQDRLLLYVYS